MSEIEKPNSNDGNQEPREDSDNEQVPRKFRGRVVEQGLPGYSIGDKVVIKIEPRQIFSITLVEASTNMYTISDSNGSPVEGGRRFHESELDLVD